VATFVVVEDGAVDVEVVGVGVIVDVVGLEVDDAAGVNPGLPAAEVVVGEELSPGLPAADDEEDDEDVAVVELVFDVVVVEEVVVVSVVDAFAGVRPGLSATLLVLVGFTEVVVGFAVTDSPTGE
jgi:hypothetical protein